MAKKTFAKICKGSFDPASPYGCAVTRVAGKACHAVTLCKGGKTLPVADRSEGSLTFLRSFEIASTNISPEWRNIKSDCVKNGQLFLFLRTSDFFSFYCKYVFFTVY